MLLPEFALLLGFGAYAGQDTCATKSDVQDLSILVDETKGEAAAARAQAAIAPQGSEGFAGLYKMSENASQIHNIANMKQIGVVGPGDWECQTQAGEPAIFACPNGEPSKCRYYRNPSIPNVTNVGACMYYYCTKTDEGPADECCQYYNGSIGISLGNASYINNGLTFSDFANTPHATTECVAVADHLKTHDWHNEWWEDNTLDAYGNPPARAYINFEILRLEFSTTYGLYLIASNGDQLNIAKYTDDACNEPSAGDDCYFAEFQPINSKTLLTIRAEEQFGLNIDNTTTGRRLRSRSGYRMLQAGKAEKRNTLVTVKQAKQEHIAHRFSESCDKNKPGCTGGSVPPVEPQSRGGGALLPGFTSNSVQGDRRHSRMLRRGAFSSIADANFLSSQISFDISAGGGANNRAGNGRM